MMHDSMDAATIVAYFKGKSILITGSTSFLGKILVEKILRVQPDAKKMYLLVRGTDAALSAKQRVQEELMSAVTGTGSSWRSPSSPVSRCSREGTSTSTPRTAARQRSQEWVYGRRQQQRAEDDGKEGLELGLQRARHFGWSNTYVFTKAMGEMLLEQLRGDKPVVVMRPSIITSVRADPLAGWMQNTRTIDTFIIGYAKQNLPCFLADLSVVMDVIPGDMVTNAMIAAVVAHSEDRSPAAVPVYHVTSSLCNPVTYSVLYESILRHFYQNPRVGKDGKIIPTREIRFFSTTAQFHLYMMLTFKLPLKILQLVNLLLCGFFSRIYNNLNRKYKFVVHLVDVYGPFAFFNGCFEDMNMEQLRLTMAMKTPQDHMFNFDTKTIDWDDYFTRIHIPGVLKYLGK